MRKHILRRIVLILLCFLLPSSAAFAKEYNAYINSKTKIYFLPTSSSRSFSVPKGLTVKVTSYNSGWCHIKRGNNKAYIPAKYLTAASASKVDKIILTAMDQVGKKYGRNPPKKFDCSALVQYCFGKHGYKVKSTAARIANDNTYPKIRKSNIVRGDIICMDGNGDGVCDHVAIYCGKGYMIEASFTAGIVRVKKINSWYRNHIMFARRVS